MNVLKQTVFRGTIVVAAALGAGGLLGIARGEAPSLPMPDPGQGDTILLTGWKRPVYMIVPANLDGDDVLDWVAKNNAEADGTVMLEARTTAGAFLWEYDTKIPAKGRDKTPEEPEPPPGTADGTGAHEPVLPWDLDEDGVEELVVLGNSWSGTLAATTTSAVEIRFNRNAKPYPSRWANRHYRQDVARAISGYPSRAATFRVQELFAPGCARRPLQAEACLDEGLRRHRS